jgi:hypothetical protein
VPLLEQYVAEQGGMSREEAKAWADEQRELGDRDEFFLHGHPVLLYSNDDSIGIGMAVGTHIDDVASVLT